MVVTGQMMMMMMMMMMIMMVLNITRRSILKLTMMVVNITRQRKWLRTLDEYYGYNPATHVDIPQQPIEEPATTGQPPPLLQAAAAHIEEPATTGQPPPLLQAAAPAELLQFQIPFHSQAEYFHLKLLVQVIRGRSCFNTV